MTAKKLQVAAAQIDTTVGDIAGNVKKIKETWQRADESGADLVVTPELSITGYPLQDLAENPDLLETAREALLGLAEHSKKMKSGILVGLPWPMYRGEKPRNVVFLLEHGKLKGPVSKRRLPNYDVFDEKRNFSAGPKQEPVEFRGVNLGVLICEDTWDSEVAYDLRDQGAQVLISMNASPFEDNKVVKRMTDVVGMRAMQTGLPVLYVNQVGGQDEVVFDGGSMALNGMADVSYRAPLFSETLDMLTLDVAADGKASFCQSNVAPVPDRMEQIWMALVTGTRDYLKKVGKTEVVLGMSGGIDSALVAAIAADAIGPKNVLCVSMPYRYTTAETRSDARIAADMLGAQFAELPIEDGVAGLQKSLGKYFNPHSKGTGNENDQARTRGTMLMHISNETGRLLLSTGNKSEVSVGYCTLYGDMNGGFNPLKDVYKTTVFALAKWRNMSAPAGVLGPKGKAMPDSIITRKPSAELAPGQFDEDSLPPYEILDAILKMYVEKDMKLAAIAKEIAGKAKPVIATGRYRNAQEIVDRVATLTDRAEFKRQQACPGVKITGRSFGRGRRMPIARPATVHMLDAKP